MMGDTGTHHITVLGFDPGFVDPGIASITLHAPVGQLIPEKGPLDAIPYFVVNHALTNEELVPEGCFKKTTFEQCATIMATFFDTRMRELLVPKPAAVVVETQPVTVPADGGGGGGPAFARAAGMRSRIESTVKFIVQGAQIVDRINHFGDKYSPDGGPLTAFWCPATLKLNHANVRDLTNDEAKAYLSGRTVKALASKFGPSIAEGVQVDVDGSDEDTEEYYSGSVSAATAAKRAKNDAIVAAVLAGIDMPVHVQARTKETHVALKRPDRKRLAFVTCQKLLRLHGHDELADRLLTARNKFDVSDAILMSVEWAIKSHNLLVKATGGGRGRKRAAAAQPAAPDSSESEELPLHRGPDPPKPAKRAAPLVRQPHAPAALDL